MHGGSMQPHHHMWDARGPLAEVKKVAMNEAGQEIEGGMHLATGRPGGVEDPTLLGWQVHELRSALHKSGKRYTSVPPAG